MPEQPTQPEEAACRPRPRSGRLLPRVARIGLVTAVMSVTTLSAGAAVTSTATRSTGIVLTDWSSTGQYGSGQYGSSTSGSTTVDSEPATAAESKGVVLINTVLGYQGAAAAGTGIVLTSSGEVLTNYHVVEGATSIKVTIASTGKTYTASVVGHAQTGDIALLQLKGASDLAAATIDDDTVATGDEVTAVGNAGGTNSLTAADGTVTSLSSTITTESESGVAGETLKQLIETSADVVAGDSGGPLYDDEGEVVGIDTAASTGAEINGYAIPIANALAIVAQIDSGKETSAVQVGAAAFLGVEVSSDVRSSTSTGGLGTGGGWDTGWDDYDEQPSTGATVAGILDDSPAASAGLAAGDTLTAMGGSTVTTADDVSRLLQEHDPGDSVKISWTDIEGRSRSTTVTLAASPVA